MKSSDERKDFYDVLGARADASADDLQRCYRQLAARHHPDRGGDEEEMKAVNAAYRVLGDPAARRAYDEGLAASRGGSAARGFAPAASPGARADALSGRIVGAWLCTLSGLVLLLLVRFHYVTFLWPLALLAAGVVLLGVLMAHGALVFARRSAGPARLFGRFVWAQELAFWSCVGAGAYGLYLIMAAV